MDYRLDVTKLKSEGLPQFEKKKEIQVLYINISGYSQKSQFLICTAAVFVLYILYGYLQEFIFTDEHFKPFGWYITLVQFAFYSVFAKIECIVTQNTLRRVPLHVYALLAFLTLGTMGFSNSSLMYLNYPTQVIFKCCKLIPVMVGSILIQKKSYRFMDFLAALCMCIGLSYFTLADSSISPNFTLIGVFMISCALLCDAVIGNVQEKYMNAHNATNTEVILYSYTIGFCYLLFIMWTTGDLWRAISFCLGKPMLYWYIFLFSITGYLGVQVVLTLVSTCGALTAVTVTTCRKAVSIVISFIFFAKPFTIHYLWAGLVVILGIYLNLLSKNRKILSNFSPWYYAASRCFRREGSTKSIETTV